jgi:hypothetical protein
MQSTLKLITPLHSLELPPQMSAGRHWHVGVLPHAAGNETHWGGGASRTSTHPGAPVSGHTPILVPCGQVPPSKSGSQ